MSLDGNPFTAVEGSRNADREIAFVHMNAMAAPKSTVGRIVLFNGPPSSGKTSLVTALQHELLTPWFHLSLDDFHLGFTERSWREDEGQLFDRLVVGYLQSLRAIASSGIDVVAEAVMVPARRGLYQEVFDELPILLIGVRCSLGTAIDRERSRTDRRNGPIEFPADYFEAVYDGLTYDFESRTETSNPQELAAQLVQLLDQLTPSTFKDHLAQ
jgi:chloramphenicol 3-O phosphotransferase